MARAAAAGTALVGMGALMAWWFGQWRWLRYGRETVPVAPSTAVLLVLLGAAVWANLQWPKSRVVLWTGLLFVTLCTAIAVGIVLESLAGVRVPWEHWESLANTTAERIPIGHMSPFTAIAVVLTSFGSLTQVKPLKPGIQWRRAGGIGAAVNVAFCASTVLAYATGAPLFYGGTVVPMALLTGLALGSINFALLISSPVPAGVHGVLFGRVPIGDAGKFRPWPKPLVVTTTAAVLVVAVLVSVQYVRYQAKAQRTRVVNDLTDVALLKLGEIAAWRDNVLRDAKLLMRTPTLARSAAELTVRPEGPLRNEVSAWLQELGRTQQYDAIAIFDRLGRPLASAPAAFDQAEPAVVRLVREAVDSGDVVASDLSRRSPGAIRMDVVAPLLAGTQARVVGAILLRTDPERFLFHLLRQWPSASRTAETLLIRRDGTELTYLSHLRGSAAPPTTLRIPLPQPELIEARVVEGERGIVAGVDYRGIQVVGIGRAVPGTTWFLIAKIDAAEVFAPIRREAVVVALGTLAVLGCSVLGVGLVWRDRTSSLLRREVMLEKDRASAAQRLALVMDQANDSILLMDAQGRILEANDFAIRTYGYSIDELRRLAPGGLRAEGEAARFALQLESFQNPGGAVIETVHRRRDGSEFSVEESGRASVFDGQVFNISIARDISERKASERQIARQRQLYAVLSEINQAIVHTATVEDLLGQICRILVEVGGFAMAWIGRPDRSAGTIVPVASFGDTGKVLQGVEIPIVATDGAEPSAGSALREGATRVCHDLAAVASADELGRRALGRGYGAAASLPIRMSGSVAGVVTVYAAARNSLTLEDVSLLEEAADDVSFALDNFARELKRGAAEQELRLAHERLRRMVDANVVGIVIADPDGRFLEANDYYLGVIGYSRAEFRGGQINWRDLTPAEWLPKDEAAIAELRRRGTCTPYEKEYLRRDGTRVPVLLADALLPGPEEHIVAFVLDLTDRKKAELRIADALRFTQTLIENLPVGVLVYRASGECVLTNDTASRIIGPSRPELLAQKFRDLASWRSSGLLAVAEAALATRSEKQAEVFVTTSTGRDVWLFCRLATYEYEGQLHLMLLFVDTTERKQAERRIHEQAALLDKANEAIVVSDLDHRITFWSRGAERLFGWSADEMIGQPRNRIEGFGEVGRLAAAGGRDEIKSRNRGGDLLILETSVTELRDEAGVPSGQLTISTDITEAKRLAEHFLRAQRLESLGSLAAGIAHDFNNVLAPIGMAAALLRHQVTDPGGVRLLDTLDRCADRGAGLVRQILGFAHGIGGEPRVVQLKHILGEVADVITETFPKSIRIVPSTASELWPVVANPTQIHQVLMNLCVNARDAMPEGGTLRITAENCLLSAEEAARHEGASSGHWVQIAVADSGSGIPPDLLQKVWDPFFTTKPADQGTGLGLATVRGIVKTHRGFIVLDSIVGQGTTFRVFLPAAETEIPHDVTAPPPGGPAGAGELILLVDDEEAIRESVGSLLRAAGYQVIVAASAAAAVELFEPRADEISLVLSDIDMPGIGGAALAATLRSMRPETPILAMSGLSVRQTEEAAFSFADGFLAKPFTADAILASIRQLLDRKATG